MVVVLNLGPGARERNQLPYTTKIFKFSNFSAFHIIYNLNTWKIFLCEIFGKIKNTCEVEFQELGSVGNGAMFSCYLPSLLYFVVTSEKNCNRYW